MEPEASIQKPSEGPGIHTTEQIGAFSFELDDSRGVGHGFRLWGLDVREGLRKYLESTRMSSNGLWALFKAIGHFLPVLGPDRLHHAEASCGFV